MKSPGRFQVKAAIFDLDGTILDSVGQLWAICNHTFREVGLSEVTREAVCKAMREGGSPFSYLVPQAVQQQRDTVNRCERIAEALWPRLLRDGINLLPGVEDTLVGLVRRGIRLGIATSSWGEHIPWVLEQRGIRPLFDTLVTGLEVQNQKPFPDVIHECLRRMGAEAQQAVYVGDSPLDIRAAKKAGTFAVGVLTGISDYNVLENEDPDFVISQLDELLTLLRGPNHR